MLPGRKPDKVMNANPMDTAGIEMARQIDQHILKSAMDVARLNALTNEDQRDLVKQAVAAGDRCQARLDNEKARVSSGALNDSIYATCDRTLHLACQRIRNEVAGMFPNEQPGSAMEPVASPSVRAGAPHGQAA